MNKRIIYSLVALAVIFFIISLVIFIKSINEPGDEIAQPLQSQQGLELKEPTIVKLKPFFFNESTQTMQPVSVEIEMPPMREAGYLKFLELLLKGQPGYITPVPEGVKIRSLYYIQKQNLLVLDFNEELSNQFPGGSSAELEFIYFIVDNICYNFKEVQKVKFLISGNEAQTIAGHIDLENPFYPDYQYFNIDE